jgi:hypothetical protein
MVVNLRLCGARYKICDCDDVAAQPCVAFLVADYLNTVRESMLTKGAPGGPGDSTSLGHAERSPPRTHSSRGMVSLMTAAVRRRGPLRSDLSSTMTVMNAPKAIGLAPNR